MNRLVGKHVGCKASAALSSSAKSCSCAWQGAFISEVRSHSFLKPPRLLKQGSILTVVCRHPADCSHRYHRSTKLVEFTQTRSLNIFLLWAHSDSRKFSSARLTWTHTDENVFQTDSLKVKLAKTLLTRAHSDSDSRFYLSESN